MPHTYNEPTSNMRLATSMYGASGETDMAGSASGP